MGEIRGRSNPSAIHALERFATLRKSSMRLYAEQHLQLARLMDWAETGNCQPIDFSAPMTCQPF
jgi:hypothetical protein